MADVSEITLTGSYIDLEDVNEERKQLATGWYPAHIAKCDIATRTVRGKHRAKIYNAHVEVAPEVKDFKFTIESITGEKTEVSGDGYAGKKFRGMGVFYFLTPQPGDEFEPNAKGNAGYMYFCKALGLELKENTIKIDGKDKKVLSLPELNSDDILGKPVLACVGYSKPWRDKEGRERTSFEVKAFKPWPDGRLKDVLEDIPF